MGYVTSYTYTDDGLVSTVTKTDSQTQEQYQLEADSYDAAGNLTQQITNNGATTTQYQVDAASRTTTTTVDPSGADRVTKVTYTPDDMPATTTETGPGGAERVTTGNYDPTGNLLKQTVYGDGSNHPNAWWTLDQASGSNVTDASGTGNTAQASGVTWGNGAATLNGATNSGITTAGPVLDTTTSWSVSAWVNAATLPNHNMTVAAQSGTQNSPFYLQYNYTHGSKPVWGVTAAKTDTASPSYTGVYSSAAATANTWTHLVAVYTVGTGALQLYVNGQLVGSATDTTPFAAPSAFTIGRAWSNGAFSDQLTGSVSDVQAYPRALSASEVTTIYSAGHNGGTAGSADSQTTSWTYDQRSLPTSMTDADQNTTHYSYDEAGNLAVTTSPAVQVETDGGAPTTEVPVTTSGFDTFGDAVEETDPDGNEVRTAYDADGNKVSETEPSYTPQGATDPVPAATEWTYDSEGEVTSEQRPDGETTQYLYDQLGDVAQVTDPNQGHTHTVYDMDGDPQTVTDPTGAQTKAVYDLMGRQLTATTLERFPSAQTLTTHMYYAASATDPDGAFLSSETTPDGVSTSYGYDNLGEQTSVTDGANATTTFSYDYLGDQTKVVNPDQTSTETDYNTQQLPVRTTEFDHTGAQISQSGQTYDGNGNVLSSLDADQSARTAGDQHPVTFTYDASGMVTQEIQPVDASTSITTSFGYDADGNQTRYTDGDQTGPTGQQHNWITTYNSRGLPATSVEPTTATYTSAADSTTTYSYNGDDQLTRTVQPGGVETDMSYDNLGDLHQESGSGAEAATATRTFGYDGDGRVTSAATTAAGTPGQAGYQAATSETFGYDDRDDLLSAAGSAGTSSFGYNGDGLMTSRTDAAGTTSYGYDSDDRLQTLGDPATGISSTYSYDADSQLHTIQYGSTGQQRTFSYNDAHELTGDTLAQGSTTLASISYGYDPDGNLTSKDTTGYTGASDNAYTYDWAGRLTSWNNGSTTTAYGYDAAGNRTRVGSNVYTYDARDELTSDGVNSYSYSARGTMTQQTATSGTAAFTADAYGQQITAGPQTYGLDATGRVLTDTSSLGGASTLLYSGQDNLVASDGAYSYTYDPGGGLIGINTAGATGTSTGRLALTDQHTDVVGTFAPGATALAGSTTYDPLGNVTASSGPFGQLGYQSAWTDSATGKVEMGSRWYDPATGQFMNKDTASPNPVPDSADANPFAYVGDNPLGDTDPTGHCGWLSVSCYVHAAEHKISHAVRHIARAVVHVYHKAAKAVHHVVSEARREVHRAAYVVRDVYRASVNDVHRVYAYAARHVRRAYHAAVHYVKTAYHEAKTVVKRVVHAAAHAARTAYHATVSAVKAAAKFAKHHAAAITSFVVSTAVFAGCEAVTAGVGSIGCAAAAGAAGNLVEQGFKCADAGGSACSVGAFAGSAVEGAVAGALGGALGELGGSLLSKVLPKALDAVGGLFGKGLSDAVDDSATDATDGAAEEAASDSAASSTENGEAKAESSGAGGDSEGDPEAGTEQSSGGCPEPHSFTSGTRVLMADGSSKPISQVKVGDTIRDAVPGAKGTQVHKVQRVIVTRTDHDFVNVTIAKVGPTRVKKALRRAAFGLAASVAAFTAVVGIGGHQQAQAATRPTSTATAAAHAPASPAGGGTITTTFHHPFYDETQSAFVEAKDLHVGDLLQSTTSDARITALHLFHAHTTTYDLTIDGLHTYYVVAGTTPILVHNTNGVPGASCRIPGGAPGSRPGKPFTRAGKNKVWQANADANDGVPQCELCGEPLVRPQQSMRGVTPPSNEGAVDHIEPQSSGGSGDPSNGSLLCRVCNSDIKNDLTYPQLWELLGSFPNGGIPG